MTKAEGGQPSFGPKKNAFDWKFCQSTDRKKSALNGQVCPSTNPGGAASLRPLQPSARVS